MTASDGEWQPRQSHLCGPLGASPGKNDSAVAMLIAESLTRAHVDGMLYQTEWRARLRALLPLALTTALATTVLFSVMSHPVGAQPTRATSKGETPPVLFVCEHGTVRSLIAKVLFEEYAAQVGLRMTAVSRGTAADSVVPPWLLQRLSADHIDIGSWRPQTLRASDLANASYVVSFDVPASATALAKAPRAQWDSLPSVSRDYITGRDAIKLRVHSLVDSLARARRASKPSR